MEDKYQRHQTTLLMQYARLAAFRKAAGLIQRETDDLPGSLQSDKYVLVAILTEMQMLMEGFKHIMERYPNTDAAVKGKVKGNVEKTEDLVAAFDALSYEPEQRQKHSRKPFNRKFLSLFHDKTVAALHATKNVLTQPGRFVWVLYDDKEFLKRLDRLTELNDFLDGLLHGREARLLEECTRKSHRDIVMIRNTVEQLENLVLASILLQERRSANLTPNNTARRRSDRVLKLMVNAKQMKLVGDPDGPLGNPPSYNASINPSVLCRAQVLDLAQVVADFDDEKSRPGGSLKADNGMITGIWVEWRAYKTEYDTRLNYHVPQEKEIHRIKHLTSLLMSEKPQELCVPTCLGYFDDRGDVDNHKPNNPYRFGLVFERPEESSVPKSLHRLLGELDECYIPSLTVRAALASKVATCILYLHATSWLHHDVRSDNIIFPDCAKISEPLLSGFDFSRPDTMTDQTIPCSDSEIPDEKTLETQRKLDLARHPSYQGLRGRQTYRKSFDVYGLGIVLLEIALWEKIEDIVEYPERSGIEYCESREDIENYYNDQQGRETAMEKLNSDLEKRQSEIAKNLKSELEDPDSKVMKRLRVNFGDKYHKAVITCIQGGKAFGIEEGANELDGVVGMKFQRGFTEDVVDALTNIET